MGSNNIITYIVLRQRRRSDTPESARAGIRYIQANSGGEPKKASRPNRLYNIYYVLLLFMIRSCRTPDHAPKRRRRRSAVNGTRWANIDDWRRSEVAKHAVADVAWTGGAPTLPRRRPMYGSEMRARTATAVTECTCWIFYVLIRREFKYSTTKWKNSRLRNVNNYYTLTQNI